MAQPISLRNPFTPLQSREETVYGPGVPPIIVRVINVRWFLYVEGIMSNAVDGDRFLVRRDHIIHRNIELTVDYISARILTEWFRYTVVYIRNTLSPFPHTVDMRDPIHVLPVN